MSHHLSCLRKTWAMKELSSAKPSPPKRSQGRQKKRAKGPPQLQPRRHHSRRPSKNIESFASYFPRGAEASPHGLESLQEAVNIVNSFGDGYVPAHSRRGWAPGPQQQVLHCHLREIQTSVHLLLLWGDGQACCVRGHQHGHQIYLRHIG